MLEKLRIALKSSYDRVYFTKELRYCEPDAFSTDETNRLEPRLGKRFSQRFKWLVGAMCFSNVPQFSLMGGNKNAPRNQTQRLMQFLGLSFFSNQYDYSILDVLKYLADWQPNESAWSNLPRAVIFLTFNLIRVVLLTVRNAIKLITEFLPRALLYLTSEGIIELAKRIKVAAIQLSRSKSALSQLGLLGLTLLQSVSFVVLFGVAVVTGLWYFVGCAITSPADAARSAYKTGDHLANQSLLGKILGVIFATVSLLTTACAYAILFPLAIKLLITQAPTVLPAIVNTISGIVGSFSASAGVATANFLMVTLPSFLAGLGATIGVWFASLNASVAGFLSTWLFTAPTLVGLTGFSAAVFSTASITTAVVDGIGETTQNDVKVWFQDVDNYMNDFDTLNDTFELEEKVKLNSTLGGPFTSSSVTPPLDTKPPVEEGGGTYSSPLQ